MTREEHKEVMQTMFTKSKEEINTMFDSGMFNEIVKGYCQMIADGKGTIEELLEEVTSGEAREYYQNN